MTQDSDNRDPSRQGASSRLLQEVLDSLPHWVSVKDQHNRYLLVNRALAGAFGMSPQAFIADKNARPHVSLRTDGGSTHEMDARVLREGLRQEVPRMPVRLHDGSEQIRRLVKFPLLDAQGRPEGIIGWSEDITEQVATETHLAQRNQQLMEDLTLAAEFQRTVLPDIEHTEYLEVSYRFLPHSLVSGDVYKWFYNREHEYNFFLGDATGHGFAAAFLAMMVHVSLSNTRGDMPPVDVVKRLNTRLCEQNLDGKFISGVFFRIKQDGTLRYCSAGHPPLVLVRDDGHVELLATGDGMALGWFPEPPGGYREHALQLQPGDRLYAYTDGITEWANAEGRQFGLQHFAAFVGAHHGQAADVLLDGLLSEVRSFSAGAPNTDDISLFCFEYTGQSLDAGSR